MTVSSFINECIFLLSDVFSNKVSRGLDTTKQLSVIDMDIVSKS